MTFLSSLGITGAATAADDHVHRVASVLEHDGAVRHALELDSKDAANANAPAQDDHGVAYGEIAVAAVDYRQMKMMMEALEVSRVA